MADDMSDKNESYQYPFEMAEEQDIKFGDGAIEGRPAGVPGSYDLGGSTRWTPEAISEVHALAQLGRYQVRGYNTFNKSMPNFDDLTFVPATMTRLPLEGYREKCDTTTILGGGRGLVEKPIELKIPIYIASMSFGALSANAKEALGHGASKVGTMTCTGEGGMLEEERAASKQLVYQLSPSRYGLDLDHLRRANGVELVVGQGAKPGTGGLLLGMKVSERISEMRTLPLGVDQRSTCRHPDWLGADDLAVKIEELRIATNYQVPIFIKMGATRPRFDVAVAAKAGADVVVVDGAEGGTGASPELLLNHTGIPTMSAIRAAREALDECGMSGKVTLVAAGGIRSGVDAAKCLALGADAVMIGNAAMIALGCNSPRYLEDYEKLGTSPGACHHCHTGMCPVGVATQDPELERRMNVAAGAERVARYLTAMTMEVTSLAKACGKSSVHNLEPEDLRALSFEASAFTGVKMAGIDREFDWDTMRKA
ncbi:MAG: FMN-binding glutamate synthase family protein [Thiolinea sp.]